MPNPTPSTSSAHPNGMLNPNGDLDLNLNVSPLEQEVLDEYVRLARNMERLSETLTLLTTPSPPPTNTTTASPPPPPPPPTIAAAIPAFPPTPPLTHEIAESLRLLERKVASVYTLMKASVYSIVLQQGEMYPGVGGQEREQGQEQERLERGLGRWGNRGDRGDGDGEGW